MFLNFIYYLCVCVTRGGAHPLTHMEVRRQLEDSVLFLHLTWAMGMPFGSSDSYSKRLYPLSHLEAPGY